MGVRLLACGAVATVVALVGLAERPAVMAAALAIGVVVVVFVTRPSLLAGLTVFLAFATMPAFVPVTVPFIPLGVYLYEVPLVATVLWLTVRRRSRVSTSLLIFAAVLVVATIVGLAKGHGESATIRDVRNLVDLTLGAVAAQLGWEQSAFRTASIRSAAITLWFSAVTTVLASLGSLQITATVTEIGAAQTSRFQTTTNFFAVAVLSLSLSLWLGKNTALRTFLTYAVPSAVVLLISFSRNSLIGLAVAIVLTPVGLRSIAGVARVALRSLTLLAVGWFVIFVAPAFPGGSYLHGQFVAFQQRVIDGLSGSALSQDGSTQFRLQEIRLITPEIAKSPFVGHGFGASYKPPVGASDSFLSIQAPYYCHDVYYWLALKIGILGLALFAWMVLIPVYRCLRRGSPTAVAVAATLSSYLAISVVAPVPNGAASGLSFGLVLGLATVMSRAHHAPVVGRGRVVRRSAVAAASPRNHPALR